MRSLADGGIGWLRRLWLRADEDREPDREVVLAIEEALGAVELSVCDGIAHHPVSSPTAAHAAPIYLGDAPPCNAFGVPIQEEPATGPEGAVAVATGMALAGLRATALLRGHELERAHASLRAASERLAPLVLHAVHSGDGHGAYHAIAGCGLFQVFPSSAQETVDLTLVARWLAERALVPGLVATDGDSVENLRVPDAETVRRYLGPSAGPIVSPTEAQRTLFGAERPRLVRWFDADRPVATGGVRGARDRARARFGDRLFFRDPVRALARQGMEELSRMTGRPLDFLYTEGLDNAEVVLVAQGALVRAARAAADRARRGRGQKVGVVGVTWLRPLPAEELIKALEGRGAVAVVEAAGDPLAGEPPLFRELRALVGTADGWVSATSSDPALDPSRLVELCERMRTPGRPKRVRLDRVTVRGETGFPRRDALLQALANDFPALKETEPLAAEPAESDLAGVRSAGLLGVEAELPPDALTRLAAVVAEECGPVVRGSASRPEAGVFEARVRASAADFVDPGARVPVSLLLATQNPRELGPTLAGVAPGGTLLLGTNDAPERIWTELPESWRREIRERELRLLAVAPGLDAGLDALRGLLRSDEQEGGLAGSVREVDWSGLSAPGVAERDLPRVVRRIERVRATYDSLPRFWGEVVQPAQEGALDGVPDPLTTTGIAPAGASALQPEPAASALPWLDPEKCSGCGRCWSACPESAIGVTAIGGESLLTAASRAAGTSGKAADALRRAHKHLATRLSREVRDDADKPLPAALREAWAWTGGRMNLSDEDRPQYESAFEATCEAVARLRPSITRPFFGEPEEDESGAGELLVLAFDPRACNGCGLCVAECPEDAIQSVERTPQHVAELESHWRAWEELPDTPGATLARVADHPEVGPLAAALLSRHCAQAQSGGGAGEPGSGERLAARLVTALVERHAQRHLASLVGTLEQERATLEQTLQKQLGEGLTAAGTQALADALSGVSGGRAAISELGERLDALGARASFDRRPALRLAELAGELEHARKRLAEGEDGLGRARFGAVVVEGTVGEWAARFPLHPWYAPLTRAPTSEGVEMARGIARGLAADHLSLIRSLRRARLEVEAPPDRSARLEAIGALGWEDLEPEERASCPPLLLIGDDTALVDLGFDALTRVLSSNLPIKVVLLDARGRLGGGPEPALVAMAHREAFALATSIAHPDHLARGIADALSWPGPALLHLHAPSPRRHGFAPDATLERARSAVEGRAHVLFRYDPSAEGVFGLRASLDGNPEPDRDWGGVTFGEWAAGERRFAAHFEPATDGVPLAEWLSLPETGRSGKSATIESGGERLALGEAMARAAAERLALWNTLRELTGAAGPFAELARAAVEKELEADHQRQLDELRADYESRIAALQSGADEQAIARLRERLMTLAGYGAKDRPGEGGA